MATSSITVHHLERSRSQRILWLLEELGLPYELREYKRDRATLLAPPEMKQLHPLGKAPIVTDGDLTLVESGAILEYLVERYGEGRLAPKPGTPEHLRYRYWMHYAEGSAMPPLLLRLVFTQVKAKAPLLVRPIARGIADKVLATFVDPQLRTHLAWIEGELGKSTWLAGDELTAADIQMSYPIQAAVERVPELPHPRMEAFVERMKRRPAWQRAYAKGGSAVL